MKTIKNNKKILIGFSNAEICEFISAYLNEFSPDGYPKELNRDINRSNEILMNNSHYEHGHFWLVLNRDKK